MPWIHALRNRAWSDSTRAALFATSHVGSLMPPQVVCVAAGSVLASQAVLLVKDPNMFCRLYLGFGLPCRCPIVKIGSKGGFRNRSVALGTGVSSVDAGFPLHWNCLGLERISLHVFVAEVVPSSDTVDRSVLNCALDRLGLPQWCRRVHFSFHALVRLRFQLAAGLGSPWCGDEGRGGGEEGGRGEDSPISMVFVSLCMSLGVRC